MVWIVKRVTKVAAVMAATGACVAGMSAFALEFASLAHEQRDENDYQTYVTGKYDRGTALDADGSPIQDPRENDFSWAARHPEVMLAEGDRACDWLAEEPDPPRFGADESRYDSHAMTTRYLKTADMDERIRHTNLGQRYVVAGAWSFLCPVIRDEKTMRTGDED